VATTRFWLAFGQSLIGESLALRATHTSLRRFDYDYDYDYDYEHDYEHEHEHEHERRSARVNGRFH
jgi:hypothetical protein